MYDILDAHSDNSAPVIPVFYAQDSIVLRVKTRNWSRQAEILRRLEYRQSRNTP